MASLLPLPPKLPGIDEADLHAFHKVLFGVPFVGHGSLTQTIQGCTSAGDLANAPRVEAQQEYQQEEYEWPYVEDGNDYDDDDGLGYYPDGVKRTLTDEQIAMFRHSEIQALLRERRLAREREESEMSAEPEEGDDNVATASNPSHNNTGEEQEDGEVAEDEDKDDGDDGHDDEEEREYAEFLRQERLEFQQAAAAKRNGERMTYDPSDRTISTRRKVREMDEIQASTDTLMYDDDDDGTTASKQARQEEKTQQPVTKQPIATDSTAKPQGRKFWWPEIRPAG